MADPAVPVLITRRRVSEISGLQRSALYQRIGRGEFPRPVTVGSAAVRWIEAEVIAWVQQQIDASRAQSRSEKAEADARAPVVRTRAAEADEAKKITAAVATESRRPRRPAKRDVVTT